MAKRFTSSFYSTKNVYYTVEIWDTVFSGTAIPFDIAANNFQLTQAGSGEKILNHISPTSCQFDLLVQNTDHEDLIADLLTAPEGQFTVAIFKGLSPVLYWAGQIVADIGSYEEDGYPYRFTIKATDGMGLLKTVDYKDTAGAYTGKSRALDVIKTCLKKLPYVGVHYTGTSLFVTTVLDVWAAGMVNDANGTCSLYQSYIDNSVWQTYDKGVEKYTNCYDVIDNILKTFMARITQRNGVFWIENIFYRTETTVIERRYTRDGGLSVTANFGVIVNVDQTSAGALLNGGVYEFFPGLKSATHVYESNARRNFLESAATMDESEPLIQINKPINANINSTTLRFTGNIGLSIKSLDPDPTFLSPLEPFCIIFRINLALNTVGLARGYTVLNTFQVNYGPTTWETSPGFYVALRIDNAAFLVNTTGDVFTFTQALDIMTPFLPESCDDFSISMAVDSLQKYSGGTYNLADFEITFKLDNQWLEVYSFGSPAIAEDEIEYETLNTTNTTNTATLEQTSLIGTTSDPNHLGALWVKPASTFNLANVWQTGVTTPNTLLEYLITEIAMSGQYAPTKRLNGTLYGTIDKLARFRWLDEIYLFLGGTWNADMDELNGDWVLLRYDQDFVASPPKKRKLTSNTPQVPPHSPSNGLGGSTYEMVAKPPGTLLYPTAATTSTTSFLSGPVTTIPISGTLTDGDFYAGDTITIVNPLTGEYNDLTVNATSTAGQTSVSVTGTLTTSFPSNAPIIKKPKIGGYSPSQQTTVTTNYTFSIPAGRWVVAVAVESGAQTVNIGSTNGGSEYSMLDVSSGTPNTVTIFAYGGGGGANIYFTGITISTKITVLTI